jgi:hypothetical protein
MALGPDSYFLIPVNREVVTIVTSLARLPTVVIWRRSQEINAVVLTSMHEMTFGDMTFIDIMLRR